MDMDPIVFANTILSDNPIPEKLEIFSSRLRALNDIQLANLFSTSCATIADRSLPITKLEYAARSLHQILWILNPEPRIKASEIVLNFLSSNVEWKKALKPLVTELTQMLMNSSRSFCVFEGLKNLASNSNEYSVEETIEIFIKVIEFAHFFDDCNSAERFLIKLQNIYSDLPPRKLFIYENLRAGTFMKRKKYLDAGFKYLSLLTHQIGEGITDPSVKIHVAERAILSAILSPISKRKKTLMDVLISLQDLPISPELFQFCLTMKDGSTVPVERFPSDLENLARTHLVSNSYKDRDIMDDLKKALVQHNMTVICNHYESISFSSLAKLLATDIERASELIMNLISEGVIHGTVDQTNQQVLFYSQDSSFGSTRGINYSSIKSNDLYLNILNDISSVVQTIKSTYPEWYQQIDFNLK